MFDALRHPALFENSSGREALVAGDEAGCFYHPQKKAIVPCDACGRFLCGLCDVDLAGKHYCPVCLDKGGTTRSIPLLENYRVSYPDIALLLALAPVLIWPLTLFTAPAAIFVGITGWNKPPSLTGRKKRLRTLFAIAFAAIQVCGWIALFVLIFSQVARLF